MPVFKINEEKIETIAKELKVDKDVVALLSKHYTKIQNGMKEQYLAHIIRTMEVQLQELTENQMFKIIVDPVPLSDTNFTARAQYQQGQFFWICYPSHLDDIQLRVYLAHELGHLYLVEYINNIGIENLKTLEFLTSDFKDLSLNQEVNIRLIHQKKENVITVPVNAVVKRKSKNGKTDKYYIYLIDKNNKVTEKEVLVGMNNGEKIEISGENIKEGMEIVVNPNDKIKNNVIVKRIDYKQIKINKEKELEKLQRENEQKKKDIEKNEAEIIRLKRNEK